MEFLRPEFEEAIAPFIDGGVVTIGRFSYKAATILNLAGDDAYKQVFDDWYWEDWIPARRERKDEILRLRSNETRFNDLEKMIASNGAIPFIGSGMSSPTGMPTWASFLRETCKQTKNFKVSELNELLTAGKFETAATRIFRDMPEQLFNERFESNFNLKPTRAVTGAVRLLPYLFDAIVITTNFDGILELVYGGCGITFHEILRGMGVGEFRTKSVLGARCLLKLHGNYAESNGRVLLKNEYDAFYKMGCSGRDELTLIFRRGGLLFLGCSLNQDRTMVLLKEIADSDKNMPRHYAFLKKPDSEKKTKDRDHFLAERNVFPIWYDGDHDGDIEALLVGLMEDLRKL